jgi:DNA repair protein RadC
MDETGVAALRIVAVAARRMARSEVSPKSVLASQPALIVYLAIDMPHLTLERARILYLDARNRLIDDHHLGDGPIDEAAIHAARSDPAGDGSRRRGIAPCP